jgi:hypothetical protein
MFRMRAFVLLALQCMLCSAYIVFPRAHSRYSRVTLAGRFDGPVVTSSPVSPEEGLDLAVSVESLSFLNNIEQYGNNRMARRAVGILQKMPAYKVPSNTIHYTLYTITIKL